MITPTPRRARFKPPIPYRRVVAGGAAALVLAAGTWWGANTARAARTVVGRLPAVTRALARRHTAVALETLATLASPAALLEERLAWLTFFRWLPGWGPKIRSLEWDVALVATAARASADLVPALRAGSESSHPLHAFLRRLTPRAVLASARAAETIERMPETSWLVPASTVRALSRLKRGLRPWEGLARMALHHPRGVKTLLSSTETTRFLVLFQDSGELRSTGGFLAAYGYLTWHDRRLQLTFEPDIGALNNHLTRHLPAPWVIREYFHQPRLSFINANLNPNVPASARVIEALYRSVPRHRPVQGIVWVDSWFADAVLRALGPVHAEGTTFTAENLIPLMEAMAERRPLPGNRRLLFLGSMLNQLKARAESSVAALTALGPVVRRGLADQDVMLYANNPTVERWLVQKGWAGAIGRLAGVNSFLLVNDNYGGLKDNDDLATNVRIQLIHHAHGAIIERVTTTWTMTGVADGWMIGTYVGYVECIVPRGTRLLRLSGPHHHGIRRETWKGLDREVYGTGILLAARRNPAEPPKVERLTWTFELPRLTHTGRLVYLLQPGSHAESLTYLRGATWVTEPVHHRLTIHLS
ncbi:MAG: DUF4012 domain-containing protein [Firmicutes bacterium]|nr:DUF4012 domain-containing protein [Bacillota bacterium]